jgi:hypothetical protein
VAACSGSESTQTGVRSCPNDERCLGCYPTPARSPPEDQRRSETQTFEATGFFLRPRLALRSGSRAPNPDQVLCHRRPCRLQQPQHDVVPLLDGDLDRPVERLDSPEERDAVVQCSWPQLSRARSRPGRSLPKHKRRNPHQALPEVMGTRVISVSTLSRPVREHGPVRTRVRLACPTRTVRTWNRESVAHLAATRAATKPCGVPLPHRSCALLMSAPGAAALGSAGGWWAEPDGGEN